MSIVWVGDFVCFAAGILTATEISCTDNFWVVPVFPSALLTCAAFSLAVVRL